VTVTLSAVNTSSPASPSAAVYALCPSGTYNPATGSSAASSCGPCPSGGYCPAGSLPATHAPIEDRVVTD
jgi:hypothetical protein